MLLSHLILWAVEIWRMYNIGKVILSYTIKICSYYLLFLILATPDFVYFLAHGTLFRTEFCLNSYCHESQVIDCLTSWSIVPIFSIFLLIWMLVPRTPWQVSPCVHMYVQITTFSFILFRNKSSSSNMTGKKRDLRVGWLVGLGRTCSIIGMSIHLMIEWAD